MHAWPKARVLRAEKDTKYQVNERMKTEEKFSAKVKESYAKQQDIIKLGARIEKMETEKNQAQLAHETL